MASEWRRLQGNLGRWAVAMVLPGQGLGDGDRMMGNEMAVSPQSSELLPPLHGETFGRWELHHPWGRESPCLSSCLGHLPSAAAVAATRGSADAAQPAGEGWDPQGP